MDVGTTACIPVVMAGGVQSFGDTVRDHDHIVPFPVSQCGVELDCACLWHV